LLGPTLDPAWNEQRAVIANHVPKRILLVRLRNERATDAELLGWARAAFTEYQMKDVKIGRVRVLELFGNKTPRICASTQLSTTNRYTLWWLKGQDLVDRLREVWRISPPSDTRDMFE